MQTAEQRVLRLIEISERQSETEAELPLVVLGTGDCEEVAPSSVAIRVIEVWRIKEIGCIGTELQVKAFLEFERSEQAEVHVHRARPKQCIAANVPVCIRRWIREHARIIEWVSATNSAEFSRGTTLVGSFCLTHTI